MALSEYALIKPDLPPKKPLTTEELRMLNSLIPGGPGVQPSFTPTPTMEQQFKTEEVKAKQALDPAIAKAKAGETFLTDVAQKQSEFMTPPSVGGPITPARNPLLLDGMSALGGKQANNFQSTNTYLDPQSLASSVQQLAELDPYKSRLAELADADTLYSGLIAKERGRPQNILSQINLEPFMASLDALQGTNIAGHFRPQDKQSTLLKLVEQRQNLQKQKTDILKELGDMATAKAGQFGFKEASVLSQLGLLNTLDKGYVLTPDKLQSFVERSGKDDLFKKVSMNMEAGKMISSLLSQNIPGAQYYMRTALARFFGDDKIAVADIQAQAGDPALAKQVYQAYTNLIEGRLDEHNLALSKFTMQIVMTKKAQALMKQAIGQAAALGGNYNLPPDKVIDIARRILANKGWSMEELERYATFATDSKGNIFPVAKKNADMGALAKEAVAINEMQEKQYNERRAANPAKFDAEQRARREAFERKANSEFEVYDKNQKEKYGLGKPEMGGAQ